MKTSALIRFLRKTSIVEHNPALLERTVEIEKARARRTHRMTEKVTDAARTFINCYGEARLRMRLAKVVMDAVRPGTDDPDADEAILKDIFVSALVDGLDEGYVLAAKELVENMGDDAPSWLLRIANGASADEAIRTYFAEVEL